MAQQGEGQGTAVPAATHNIEQDERYQRLVTTRSRFGWRLTILMLIIYFGYILLIAFEPHILARPLGSGVTSLGIPLGLGVIIAGIALTAIYVRRANKVFDRDLDALRKDYGA